MDRNSAIGIVGSLASWGLVEVQLVFAMIASIFTIVWMGISIWKHFKGK
jgi:hypothetical protein